MNTKPIDWLKTNSLWLVAIGLMLASSGIDGAYMEKLNAWTWFGYILNTTSDIANPILMYWYARLQQDRSLVKKRNSRHLLKAEWVAIGYSWLFSWRQLRPMVYRAETSPLASELGGSALAIVIEVELLAFAFAGFIPLLLAFIGYAQALLAGRIENEPAAGETEPAPAPLVAKPAGYTCEHCGRVFGSQPALNAHKRVHIRSNGHKPAPEPTIAQEER